MTMREDDIDELVERLASPYHLTRPERDRVIATLKRLSTLTDEMVERGAEGMDPELWAYATPEDWNGARERLRKYAKRCLTEAIRAAKGE